MTIGRAPGKIILFGEHSVVYGEPAIAMPVTQVAATAEVLDADHGRVRLIAPDLGESWWLDEAPAEHALAATVQVFEQAIGHSLDSLDITVQSQIPIASGLGSGAAIAAALIQALGAHLGRDDLTRPGRVSELTYEVEKIHHGTPSGIDNTVVSYARPVYFVRANAPVKPREVPTLETFSVGSEMTWLIADTGVRAPTKVSVGDVRAGWQAEPTRWEPLFAACGEVAIAARAALESGKLSEVGRLMTVNQALLRQLTVSSEALDRLVNAAIGAGALGAKLSGGGRGGNMIALAEPDQTSEIKTALRQAGAVRVLETTLIAESPHLSHSAGSTKPAVSD